jgi:beta-1,2-mannobiose phosphorylase / 1,2-beta-oligomannan phosphorylase
MIVRSIISIAALSVLLSSPPACAQVKWTRHQSNPVFSTSAENPNNIHNPYFAFGPAVLWDDSQRVYLAWFESLPGTALRYSISHALSIDGALWYYCSYSPSLEPEARGFDSLSVRGPSVIRDATGYKMYYSASDGSRYTIGLATSADGVRWKKYSANPILKPGGQGSWDDSGVLFCKVLLLGSRYYMWYSGRDGSTSRIGVATSNDGFVWTKYAGNPVINVGAEGEWDGFYVEAPAVTLANGLFYMVYTARPQKRAQQIGLATSVDGLTWKKYCGNPVLTGVTIWEGENVAVASLLFKENTFHLWYSANGSGKWQAGYATSPLEYPPNPRPNAILNSGFEFSTSPWDFSGNCAGEFSVVSPGHESANAARITLTRSKGEVHLRQPAIMLEPRTTYRLSFAACSNQGHSLVAEINRVGATPITVGIDSFRVELQPAWKRFSIVFTTSDFPSPTKDIRIQFSPHGNEGDQFYIDNISIAKTLRADLEMDPKPSGGAMPSAPYIHAGYMLPSIGRPCVEIVVPMPGYLSLDIFNTLGQYITTLLDAEVPAGHHRLRFDRGGFPAGIYFYRLTMKAGSRPIPAVQGKLLFLD